MSLPKIQSLTGYRYLCAGKSLDRATFSLVNSIATECCTKIENVVAAIDAYENPAQTLATASGMRLGTAQTILDTLKRRDAANKATLAKAAAPRAAHDSCRGCGRVWAGTGSAGKLCGVCVAEHRAKVAPQPTPAPRHAARHAPAPGIATRVDDAAQRGAVIKTSLNYQRRQAEAARRSR